VLVLNFEETLHHVAPAPAFGGIITLDDQVTCLHDNDGLHGDLAIDRNNQHVRKSGRSEMNPFGYRFSNIPRTRAHSG